MIWNCPHCRKNLQLSDSYQQKLQQALSALEPGKRLTIKCTNCTKPIMLDRSSSAGPVDTIGVKPPPPPDIDWIKQESFSDEEEAEDLPMALYLAPDKPGREKIRETMETIGYQVLTADSVPQALERMNMIKFFCIIYHTDFEEGDLDDSTFHQFMRQMPMTQRRYIFYVIIGPRMHTLYDLQALALSANLTINEQDLSYIENILHRAVPSYEQMFGPMMEELKAYGKN
ncbi:MAG: hypothetical protein OEV64_11455 [Desulfobulbaceae bacterium]|nr:hypothetical protein [Desulfobulbaceae bacterium]